MWYNNLISKIISFVKANWKVLLIVLLTIAFLFLLLRKPKVKIISRDNSDILTELKQYKDRNGNLVSQVNQLQVSKEELKSRSDSLLRELKVNKNKVRSVDHYISSKDTIFSTNTQAVYLDKYKDTAYRVSHIDNYLTAEALASKDTGWIHISLIDTLDRVEVHKSGFLGFNPKTEVLLRSKSPYINYTQGYSMTIKEKTPWLTIGPSFQYILIGPYKNKVSVGVSIQIPLIKINK